jgi:hypothetical protein
MNKKLAEKWKLFIASLKLKSSFLYVVIYDALFWITAWILFSLFIFILDKKASAIDTDALSGFAALTNITAAQTQELQQLAQSMQGLFYFSIFGIIFLIAAALLLFTLTRAFIWNHLLKKKFNLKKYLRFNLLNILLAAILVIILLIIFIIRMPVMAFLVNISVNLALIVSSILFLIIFTAAAYFVSLAYINYTLTGKIFNSFDKTFKLIKNKFADISCSYLFILTAAIAVSFIAKLIWLLPSYVQKFFNMAVVILFMAWMRIYIVNVIKQ